MSSLLKWTHHSSVFQRQAGLANLKYAILAPVCLTLFRDEEQLWPAAGGKEYVRHSRPTPAGLCQSYSTAGLWTKTEWNLSHCQMRPNSIVLNTDLRETDSMRDTVKVTAYQTLYCMIHGVVLIVLSGHTGTAAIRVGCRTLVSPLLPFLIFVDFGWETEAI